MPAQYRGGHGAGRHHPYAAFPSTLPSVWRRRFRVQSVVDCGCDGDWRADRQAHRQCGPGNLVACWVVLSGVSLGKRPVRSGRLMLLVYGSRLLPGSCRVCSPNRGAGEKLLARWRGRPLRWMSKCVHRPFGRMHGVAAQTPWHEASCGLTSRSSGLFIGMFGTSAASSSARHCAVVRVRMRRDQLRHRPHRYWPRARCAEETWIACQPIGLTDDFD